jgi:hypothetical protein
LCCDGQNGLEDRVLNLAWTWGFKDTVALTFLAMQACFRLQLRCPPCHRVRGCHGDWLSWTLQGAVFAAVTGFGNEPHLTTSFTAGVAMRINAYERFPESCMQLPPHQE